MTTPDLSAFARAVRFRDRVTAAAVSYHERVGLVGSMHYARATFDAISELIREDERERLAAVGRLVSPDDLRADLEIVLKQRMGHCHQQPGVWDADGAPCVECAARARLACITERAETDA